MEALFSQARSAESRLRIWGTKKPGGLRGSPGISQVLVQSHKTLADGRKRSGLSVQQATQQRLFLAVWEFGHCAPGPDTGATNDSPHSGHPGVGAFLRFRAIRASCEATKHALVLIAPVFVLHSTNVDGPGHQAKNICREKAQPLLLLGCEGCGKRLPCVGKLFELS
jgi:hypothetical protein